MGSSAARWALFVGLLIASTGLAQQLDLTAPPDRLVLPGDFVTLVFHVTSAAADTVSTSVEAPDGYAVLAPPPELELEPGKRAALAVTVEIPLAAQAFSAARIVLMLRGAGAQVQADVTLTVGARSNVTLSAPVAVTLDHPVIPVTVTNLGNVEKTVRLQASGSGDVSTDTTITVAVGASTTIEVTATAVGTVSLTLTGEDVAIQQALVRIVREGLAPPSQLALDGVLEGRAGVPADATASLDLHGPLSDYLDLDLSLAAPTFRDSYLALTGDAWTVRLGDLGAGPFGLLLPADLGARGSLSIGPVDLGGAVAYAGGDQAAGYALAGRGTRNGAWGLAAGIDSGSPLVVAHAGQRLADVRWDGDVLWSQEALGFQVRAAQFDRTHVGTASASLTGRELLGPAGGLTISLAYGDPDLALYGSLDAPVGPEAEWAAQGGTSLRLPVALPGSLYLRASTAPTDHRLSAAYATVLGPGWQTSNQLGSVWTDRGFGWLGASSWSYLPSDALILGLDGRVIYYPAEGRVGGDVAARSHVAVGAFDADVDAGWDLDSGAVGLSASLVRDAPPWTLSLDASLGVGSDRGIEAGVSLRAAYAFELLVPDAVVGWAGGRKLGTVRGRVTTPSADGVAHGVAGIAFDIDDATVRTDASGVFEAALEPGPHRIGLVVASIPIELRYDGPTERDVDLAPKQVLDLAFPLTPVAAVRGRVVTDANGDGVADQPTVAVPATVRLLAPGLAARTLTVAADGTFEARGLTPGQATVQLAGLPLGAVAVGDAEHNVRLVAGKVAEVEFLVRPAALTAPSFSSSAPRVRRIELDADRVPPGTAPWVRVTVSGSAERVVVRTAATEAVLRHEADAWAGRIPVPDTAATGVLPFTVSVQSGDTEATRKGQVLVDPQAPAFQPESPPAVRGGERVGLTVAVYDAATEVRFEPPFGDVGPASETSPGSWTATLHVPTGTPEGVYEVPFTIERGDRGTWTGAVRLRVLAP